VADTPDGRQLFVAETGQYQVIAVSTATGAQTAITVGDTGPGAQT
jgi:sugar lactone lactonase YvrE